MGPEMIRVSGSTGSRLWSTVQVRDDGEESIRLGEPANAATVKVCWPSARPVNERDPLTAPAGPAEGQEISTVPSKEHSKPVASALGDEYVSVTDAPVV